MTKDKRVEGVELAAKSDVFQDIATRLRNLQSNPSDNDDYVALVRSIEAAQEAVDDARSLASEAIYEDLAASVRRG